MIPPVSSVSAFRRLCFLLFLLLGAFSPFAAASASADVLVSNTGQTRSSALPFSTNGIVPSQGFTTGSHARGYTLSSIDAVVGTTLTATERATVRAELWSSGTDGNPKAKLADLTVPSTVSAGTVSFAAPDDTTLSKDTTYHFLLYTTGTASLEIHHTSSDDEDSGAAAGWSIADQANSYFANTPTGQIFWIGSGSSLAIRVNGQAKALWSATLTPQSSNNVIGCTSKTDCNTRLTDNSFTVGGTAYHFTEIASSSGLGLGVSFNAAPNAALRALKFCVGSTGYSIGIAPSQILTSTNPGWTVGTPVSLKIAASCAASPQSTNTELSGLTVKSAASATGTFSALFVGTFDKNILSYSASVANSITHVKLTPTGAHSGASIKVGKGTSLTAVTSGTESSAIALSVGSNAIKVEVTAQDGTTKQTYTVTVTRAAAANNAPVFAAASHTRSVAENSAANTNIGDPIPAATDADSDPLTYTMEGTDASSFTFDASTRQIKTKASVTYDHEAKSSYSVTIKASDGTASDTVTVTISVTDVAEPPAKPSAPTVSGASTTSVSVSWSAPTNTGKPAITNYDLRYRAGSSGSWSNGPQNVTGTTATISGLTANTSYQVQVRATNAEGDGPWSDAGTGSTNTNNAPSFSASSHTRSVAENSAANTNIGDPIPAATDADSDPLTYTMEGTDASSFTFDASTRQIKTKASVTYDHEAKSSYSVTIKASDGTASDTVTVTISVTDVAEPPAKPSAPTVSGASTTSVSVSWSAPTNTGKPAITSYDLQYRAGSSGSWSNGPQNVTGTTATISGLTANTSYQVQVRATNAEGDGPWSDAGTGSTNAPNNAPSFAAASHTRSVAENSAANTNIGDAIPAATDADSDPLTYTMEGTDASSFTFDASTRQIKTKTSVTYDHEAKSSYSVTIKASDGTASDTVTVAISITDVAEPPAKPSAPTVSGASTTSLSVSWSAPTNTGKPAITSYDLQYRAGSSGSWSNGPQNVTGTTATISGLTANTSYQVQVRATNAEGDGPWSDAGTGSTNAPSNNAPVFAAASHTRSVAENTAANTNIGDPIPAATDADTGDSLTYTMEGTDASSFTFDASTRQIKTKTSVTYDHEAKSSYSVTIKASDGTDSDTVTVTITITDVAEPPAKPSAPTVSGASSTSLSVSWSAPTNTGKPAITNYDLRYRAGASGNWSNGPQNVTGTTATISSLTASTSYQVQVRATNAEGDGPWSDAGTGSTNAPTTVSAPTFSPVSGATVTDAGTNITLTFGEAIKRTAGGADFTTHAHLAAVLTLKVSNNSGADIPYAATINSAKTVITINPSSDLVDGQVYVAISTGYYDTNGNQGTAATATFTVDTTGVAAPTFSPVSGATVTDAGTNITLTFGEAIKRTAGGADFTTHAHLAAVLTLKVSNNSGADIPYAATINSAKTVITINPSSDLVDGQVYVAISTGYYDTNGNQGTAATATFTVDTTGVAAPTFSPVSGATVTDAGTNITLTFGEAIKRTAGGADFTTHAHLASVLTLKVSNNAGADIAYAATINSAKTVITINPSSDLVDGQVYVAISNAYYDANGNQSTAAAATFTVDTTMVSLSASPNPVTEGGDVTVKVTLSSAATKDLRIPVTVTAGTAEPGDYTAGFTSFDIFTGNTSATAIIGTNQDTDTDDETLTVALGTLPSGVTAGTSSSVTVIITDDDSPPGVPSGLTLAGVDRKIIAQWTAPSSGTVTRYEIQHRERGSPWPSGDIDVTGTKHEIGGLVNGTAYEVRVKAVNLNGESAWSDVRGATPNAALPSSLTLTVNGEAREGETAIVGARLNSPAHGDTVVTLSFSGSADSGKNCAGDADYWTGTDTIFIGAGDTEGTTAAVFICRDWKSDEGETIEIEGTIEETSNVPALAATLTLEIGDDGETEVPEEARLSDLSVMGAVGRDGDYTREQELDPEFNGARETDYEIFRTDEGVTHIRVTPSAAQGASVRVSGWGTPRHAVASGEKSRPLEVCEGTNDPIEIEVSRGGKSQVYTVTASRDFLWQRPDSFFFQLFASPGGQKAGMPEGDRGTRGRGCVTATVPRDAKTVDLYAYWGGEDYRVSAASSAPGGRVYAAESYVTDSHETPLPLELALAPGGATVVTVKVTPVADMENEQTTTYRVRLERASQTTARTPTTGGGGTPGGGGGPPSGGGGSPSGGGGSPSGGGGSPSGGGGPPSGGGGEDGPVGGNPPPGDEEPLSSDASLRELRVSEGDLMFSPETRDYEVTVGLEVSEFSLTPEAGHPDAEIEINGVSARSGEETRIDLGEDETVSIEITVTAPDGETEITYTVRVTRGEECGINDKEALTRFYGAAGGDMWDENDNWNSGEPLGEWYGVSADENEKAVSLLLADNNLEGEIPRELLCLAELKELALWGNGGLSGHIPENHALATERASLLYIARALSLNEEWFGSYDDPYDFSMWHDGVTTDDDGRVTELSFSGEDISGVIPVILLTQLKELETLDLECSGITLEGDVPEGVEVKEGCDEEDDLPGGGGGGGCALGGSDGSGASGAALVFLLVVAACWRRRATQTS